jgi:DNA invertase Pin-like site-specific DNA recombinase
MTRQLVAYLRVSGGRGQTANGLGIAAQREAIARFAETEGYEIIAEYVEVETGKGSDALDRRPILAAALAVARKAKASVAVAKLCRLSRDVAFISNLMAQRVPFLVTELGSMGADPFLIHIYAALAQQERARIASTTSSSLAVLRAKGAKLGNRTNLPEAQQRGAASNAAAADSFASNILPIIRQMQAQGIATERALADELNARRIQTSRGGQWHRSTVANLLKRFEKS